MAESTAAICDVYLWQWRMSSADPQGSSEIHLSADLNYLNTEQKHKNSEEFVLFIWIKWGRYHVKIP